MPKIDERVIQRVIDATDIVDVIGAFMPLRKSGTNYTCRCPFHEDRHDGNFMIRPRGVASHPNTWHCFVCDIGGDALKFLKMKEGLSFPDAIRWLGRRKGIDVDDRMVQFDIKPYVPPPPLPALELPRSLVKQTFDMQNKAGNFIGWLRSLPWSEQQRARIDEVLWMYCVGGWGDGRVVFWLIDSEGHPRAAKLMRYLPDGHRDKEEHPGWIYNQGALRNQFDPEGHTILKPLFGGHLLKRYPQADAYIVESEKTAIFCAIYFGDYDRRLWLATAGKGNLREELLRPLINQRRAIALVPDKDGIQDWQRKCEELGYRYAYVSTDVLTLQWKEADGQKADIADVLARVMEDSRRDRMVKSIADIMAKVPALKTLIEKFDLIQTS